MSESVKWKHCGLVFLIGLLLYGINLGGYDVWPPDEPRFAEVAREMMLRGDYLVPHVNGETYLEKPPLLFWSIALVSWPVEEVTPLTARIPSAASGIVIALLTYLVAARLFGTRVALWSAIVLMTCVRGWLQGRVGQIDMLLTACMMGAMYALCRWDEDRRAKWLLLLYLSITAGLLAKGPPALIFPLLFIFGYYWKDKESRRGTRWLWGALVAVALTALWYVPARMHGADTAAEAVQSGIGENLFRNTIGRMFLGVSKAAPPWHYIETIPADLLPWSLFLPWTLPWLWRRRKTERSVRFLWWWIVPALIFFSIIIGKRAIYIMPLFPAFAMLTSASVLELMDSERAVWRKRTGAVWGVLILLVAAAGFALPYTEYAETFVPRTWVAMAIIGVTGLAVLVQALRGDGRRVHAGMALSTGVILVVVSVLVFPVMNGFKSAKDFCAPVRALADAGKEFRLYSVGFSREEYIFYAHEYHEVVFLGMIEESNLDPQIVAEALHDIEKAVEDVPVADLAAPTADEFAALSKAVNSVIEEVKSDKTEVMHEFAGELHGAVADFANRFESPPAAFMFVRAEDWRWLLPLYGATGYKIIAREAVGRREVLLIANAAGQSLIMD